ncbi:hypothetical protein AB0878_36865 [Amycolatopsis sp. NPDC047767]|uniref:hypothetical protein n=1 Tax=Amycolatopsis sp. NPDC047767 TaxID=3156765 RepID=UPI00345639F7
MAHATIPDPTDLYDLDIELGNALADGDEQAVRALAPKFRAHRLNQLADLLATADLDRIRSYLRS